MEVAKIKVQGNNLQVEQKYKITRGLVGASVVFLSFSSEWDGLSKTAVFRNQIESRDVVNVQPGEPVIIPWELLQTFNSEVSVGVCGTDPNGMTVITTAWGSLGRVATGANPTGRPAEPATPQWTQQIEGQVNQALEEVQTIRPLAEKVVGEAQKIDENMAVVLSAANTAEVAAERSIQAMESAKTSVASIGSSVEDAAASAQTATIKAAEIVNAHAQTSKDAELARKSAEEAAGSESTVRENADRACSAAELSEQNRYQAKSYCHTAEAAAGQAQSYADSAYAQAQDAAESAARSRQNSSAASGAAERAEKAAQAAAGLLDDDLISAEKTQSSLALYSTLCPPFQKTGSAVVCHPVRSWPIGIRTELAVRQEGNGIPSHQNVRKFIPYNDAGLLQNGENVLDFFAPTFHYGDKIHEGWTKNKCGISAVIQDGMAHLSGKSNSSEWTNIVDLYFEHPAVLPAGEYSCPVGLSINLTEVVSGRRFQEQGTFVLKNAAYIRQAYIPVAAGKAPAVSEVPLATVAGRRNNIAYTPYIERKYEAQFPEQVYGGEVDWNRNLLILHWKLFSMKVADMNNQESCPGWSGLTDLRDVIGVDGEHQNSSRILCSCGECKCQMNSAGPALWISGSNMTQTEWKTKYPELTVQVLVEYAKQLRPSVPVQIPETPQAWPGTNMLHTDTGNTAVSCRKDPVAVMEEQQAQIEALQKAVLGGI